MVTLPVFSIRFSAMASDCEVMLAAADQAQAERLAQCAIDEVRRIETKYSRYRSDSVVARIAAQAGQDWVALDEETAHLLGYADALYGASDGRFDITSGVLRRAWDFRVARCPTDADLAPLLALIGWPRVERRPGAVRLPQAGMELDFGGFGKEYAADRAAALLAAQGVRHAYVNLGGDLRALGPQPDGAPWRIGIRDPRRMDAVIASLPLVSGALATSGDYERFIEVGGLRHCHVLDPRTGRSCSYWRSVSVLAPLTVAAGSVTTIAMLKGEAGLEFLDRSGLAYLAVDHTGRLHRRDPSGAAANTDR